MSKIILIVSTVLFALTSFGQTKYKVLAVGFYNAENFFDTLDDPNKQDNDFLPGGPYHYTGTVYQQKKHNIATVLQQMGTDVTKDGPAIVGMVEIENDNVLSDLVKEPELKQRNYQYIWFPTSDERGISTALLYNPKYFTRLSSEPLKVDLKAAGDDRPTRDILYCKGVLAGDTVHIFVNHWPSKRGGDKATEPKRKIAAAIAKQRIDEILNANPAAKILIMGDFNDNPTSESIKTVIGAKPDKAKIGLTDIYNPWYNIYKKGIGTEEFGGDWNLLDQIMISGSFLDKSSEGWKFHKNEIFNRDFLMHSYGREKGYPHRSFTIAQVWDNGYSDHFPVVMYFVKKVE